jgi:hypothetical protein
MKPVANSQPKSDHQTTTATARRQAVTVESPTLTI